MANPFYELGLLWARFKRAMGGSSPMAALVLVAALAFVLVGLPALDATAIAGLLVLALAVATVASAVTIVDAYEKKALTVFGEYRGLLEPGIHFIPPFVSRAIPFDMRTQTLDVPSQEAITEDNSPVTADAVVYIRVMDAEKAFLEVEEYKAAVGNLAQTTLRAVLGDMQLDETLSKRQDINARIRRELDAPTDEWGVRVESVEVSEVLPSPAVKGAMEQQTSAERRRRAMILEAQGRRQAAIEQAEGEKRSNVIRAQGEKQSQILEAQGDAVSTVLRAKSAESMGERAIVEKGMETLQAIGAGDSTTFVLPQELTSLLGRYGRQLTGGDVRVEAEPLESQSFDEATTELLGLDDVEELAAGGELAVEAVEPVEGPDPEALGAEGDRSLGDEGDLEPEPE